MPFSTVTVRFFSIVPGVTFKVADAVERIDWSFGMRAE